PGIGGLLGLEHSAQEVEPGVGHVGRPQLDPAPFGAALVAHQQAEQRTPARLGQPDQCNPQDSASYPPLLATTERPAARAARPPVPGYRIGTGHERGILGGSESSRPGQKPVLVDQPVVPEMIRCIKCDNPPERVRPASVMGTWARNT